MENIKNLDLQENNIYLLNVLKKIRAFYHEEMYKSEDKTISIKINDKKIKKLSKLNKIYEDIIKKVLIDNNFLSEDWKNLKINLEEINFYFENTDTKKIEAEFLLQSQGISSENAKKIIDAKDMTFNDKVQKIFNNIEKCTEDKNMLKQIIEEKLEEDEEYLELQKEAEEIKNQIKNKKIELIAWEIEEKENKIKDELKDERETLNEFLEFSAEKGELKTIDIVNKDWKKMKPIMKFSMKPVKEAKI